MDANEIEHRKKMQGIIQRIPTGVPDGWEKITYTVLYQSLGMVAAVCGDFPKMETH